MIKKILFLSVISIGTAGLYGQCSVTLSYTPASCPTCCDGCITVNVTSSCPPYTVSWYPSDPTFPVPCGACADTTYIATVTDNCACTASDTLTVTGTTGINLSGHEKHITVFPNPVNGILVISSNSNGKNISAVIIDIYGKEIYRTEIYDESTVINTNHLSEGIYFISVLEDKKIVLTEKLIVAH